MFRRGVVRSANTAVCLLLVACSMPPSTAPPVDVHRAMTPARAAKAAVRHVEPRPPTPRPQRHAGRSRPSAPATARPALPPTASQREVLRIVRAAARRYDLDVARFVRLIRCESGLNPRAVGGGGLYLGLGQQHRDYWPARAAAAGYRGASPFDPVANANTSAYLVVHGGWPNWPHCAYV